MVVFFANDTALEPGADGFWLVDASDLGFAPGEWPDKLVVNGYSYSRGEVRWMNGPEYVMYVRDHDGVKLKVFND